MTTYYHTPIPAGSPADAATFNNPLGQMDEALSEALLFEHDGHVIQDEGVSLPQRVILNFVGSGVTVTDASGVTQVSIPAATDDAELSAIAGLVSAANKIPMFSGSGSATLLDLDTDTALTANSDTKLASQKAVKAYADALVAGLLDLKGGQNCSANPNYPAASKGDAYYVSVAGKIGGASGKSVDVGDVYVASADNAGGTEASVGTSWFVLEHNLTGALIAVNNLSDVANPATARTNLGLTIGTNVQAWAAALDTLAGMTRSGNGTVLGTVSGTLTTDKQLKFDASGNIVASASDIGGSGAGTGINYLINGGFDFAQRQAPGTLTTIANNKYSADRWRVTRENADVQYQRMDAIGETGLTSKYYGRFKKITNAGKIHICQIIEGVNSVPLRGKTVVFYAKLKTDSARTFRMAVIELQNAGAIDTIPSTLITAFGANTVDPTLGANLAVITAAQSKSVTTSWQAFEVSVTVPSNSKNLICAIWSDSQIAANGILDIAEAGHNVASAAPPWTPRLIQEELSLCQARYEKSFEIDTAPVQNSGLGNGIAVFFSYSTAAFQLGPTLSYKAVKRSTPTITTFNPFASGSGWSASGAGDYTANVYGVGTTFLALRCEVTVPVSSNMAIHWTSEAEL